MEIKLMIFKKEKVGDETVTKSEEKTFVVPFVKGRMFRRVLEIFKKHDLHHLEPETVDVLVDFIVECFNGQFSRDDFYDGVAADEFIETVLNFITKIAGVGKNGTLAQNLPNFQKN